MAGEWRELRLSEAIELIGGGTPKRKNPSYWNGNIPWLSVKDFNNDFRHVFETEESITSLGLEKSSTKLLDEGQLIISARGTVGELAVLGRPMAFNQSCYGINAKAKIATNSFLFYLLKTSIQGLKKISHGAVFDTITRETFKHINALIPPLPEQKAIAHVLGSLDDKIELNRRMNETLEGMAQALFKSWFVDFDPVIDNALAAGNPIPEPLAQRAKTRRQALANGTANRQTAQAFPASFRFTEELGWIPEGWEVNKIVEEVNLVMGQSPSSDHYNKDGKGLPFHQGVTNYGERFPKHEQFSTGGNRIAEKGDILFSVRAPVGRINIADQRLIIGRGLSALRHNMDCQSYLVYFLKSIFQKEDSIGSGTIFNAVTKKDMENIPLISPSEELTLAFNVKGDSFDARISRNTKETQTLAKLRDVLLPKLISGELRIPQAEKMVEKAIA